MNLFVAIVLWMIGQRLQMDSAYYVVITLGVVVQILVGGSKNARHNNREEKE